MNIWHRALEYVRHFFRSSDAARFSHADVAAAGAIDGEIHVDYRKSLSVFDNVVRDCIHVSKKFGGITAPTTKQFYASVLFTSLVSRSVSLLILAPLSPWSDKLIEHWDYASAAGIVRTMTEIRAAFHYLCIEECSEDEWECRWNLLNLHDCISRIRLLTESPSGEPAQTADLEAQAGELRGRLKGNKFFIQLKHQERLLNGQTPYLFPIEDMIERAGLEKRTYRYLNILFSSAVHGLPMSYYRMGAQERGRGMPSPVERGYTSICLSLASTLLTRTRDEIEELFKDLVRSR